METNTSVHNKLSMKTIINIALAAAIICIFGPLSLPLPFSPVPISLTNLAVYIVVYILGMKRGTLSYIVYLLIGLVGLPVFSGFTGGAGKLLGPTGGYLIGFAFMAVISGEFVDRWSSKRYMHFIGMVLGTSVCYVFGTAWLSYQAGMTFKAALFAGVIPFIAGDLVKITAALLIGPELRRRLSREGLV